MTDFDELDDLLSQPIDVDVGKINKQHNPNQDFLTADLFSSMTDDEVLAHFMPIRGIDYDQNYMSDDAQALKKDKDSEPTIMYMADEFLPYRMLPQINPVYHLNQELFKSVIPTNRAKDNISNNVSAPKENSMEEDVVEMKPKQLISEQIIQVSKSNEENDVLDVIGFSNSPSNMIDVCEPDPSEIPSPPAKKDAKKDDDDKKVSPRPIMKRKPRTYKYNPKPLQEKVNRAFVPDDLKDVEYWERRKRNNEAAKKSRKERREKELEIMNNYESMRKEFESIKEENVKLKERNAILEKQVKECNK